MRGGAAAARTRGDVLLDDREDVLLADDQELVALDLELGPGVLGVEALLPELDVHRLALPIVKGAARTHGDDLAFLGLLLGGVRQDDARLRHLLTRGGLDDDAVAERLELRGRGGSGGQRASLLGRSAAAVVAPW